MAVDVETIVVGAGVVGLAIARELSLKGEDVLILEQHQLFGSETSARHSEVIHAGIYYPENSLKAKLCTRGKQLLYDYCDKHAVSYKRLGKIIVATSTEQSATLQSIKQKAVANGVDDLEFLSKNDISQLEPAITATAGLLSPSTGIVDSHSFMLSLLGGAESNGAMIAYSSEVAQIEYAKGIFTLTIKSTDSSSNNSTIVEHSDSIAEESMQLSCKKLINAAGHGATQIAHTITTLDKKHIPTARYAKGNYFRLQGKTPVSRLIYPVPEPGGLGVHITVDMGGQCRFGPDVQWQDSLDYSVDETRANSFYAAIRRYWPALADDALKPDYAGIRPKIEFENKAYTDFVIQGKNTHGISGLVNLFGIESPGLTSSLAIAEHVASLSPTD